MKLRSILFASSALVASLNAVTLFGDWDKSANLGLTITRGNSETLVLTGALNAKKSTDTDTYIANLTYTFGQNEGATSADEITALYDWNRIVSDKAYVGFRFQGRRDDIATIDYRLAFTAKAGYFFVKNDKMTFSVDAGPGFTTESLDGERFNFAHAYAGQNYTHQITENAFLFQSFSFYVPLDDLDRYRAEFLIGVQAKISERTSLNVTLENKYDAQPAAGAENNDLKLISGISYSF